MSELIAGIDYGKIRSILKEELEATVGARANKVARHDVDLGTARTTVGAESLIDALGLSVTILVDAGVYQIVFVFGDNSTSTLSSTELSTGDILDFEFKALHVLNTAQEGVTLTLLVDKRI